MLEKKLTDDTLENLLTLLLYRLGGEQTFTEAEIDEISKTIGGATLSIDKDSKMILRCRTRESMKTLKITKKRKKPVANTAQS